MNLNMLSNASSQVMSSGFKVLWKHLVSDARCIRTTQILAEYTENMIIRRDMYKKFHLSQTRKRTSAQLLSHTYVISDERNDIKSSLIAAGAKKCFGKVL